MDIFIEKLVSTYIDEYIEQISKKYNINEKELQNVFYNKNKGAGGKNTTILGKKFENLTDNEHNLIDFQKIKINDTKHGYYLKKLFENTEIIYVSQGGLKTYIYEFYKIKLYRNPDEAYIIKYHDGRCLIKILEKKNQNIEGSVETKLYACDSLKRDYELMLNDKFKIEYALCVSSFLQKKLESDIKKYTNLKKILKEKNIEVFYGEEIDYFKKINDWINKY